MVGWSIWCSAASTAPPFFLQERAEDLLDRSAIAMFPNVRNSGLMGRVVQCLEDGKPLIIEDLKYFSDRFDDFRRYEIRSTRAGVDLIVFTWRDVTEYFQNVERLAASEQTYRLLVENSGDVIVHTRECIDGGNEIVWVSPNVGEMLGAPVEHFLGRRLSELVPSEEAQAHAARWEKVNGGAIVKGRVRLRLADGAPRWFHLRVNPPFAMPRAVATVPSPRSVRPIRRWLPSRRWRRPAGNRPGPMNGTAGPWKTLVSACAWSPWMVASWRSTTRCVASSASTQNP